MPSHRRLWLYVPRGIQNARCVRSVLTRTNPAPWRRVVRARQAARSGALLQADGGEESGAHAEEPRRGGAPRAPGARARRRRRGRRRGARVSRRGAGWRSALPRLAWRRDPATPPPPQEPPCLACRSSRRACGETDRLPASRTARLGAVSGRAPHRGTSSSGHYLAVGCCGRRAPRSSWRVSSGLVGAVRRGPPRRFICCCFFRDCQVCGEPRADGPVPVVGAAAARHRLAAALAERRRGRATRALRAPPACRLADDDQGEQQPPECSAAAAWASSVVLLRRW